MGTRLIQKLSVVQIDRVTTANSSRISEQELIETESGAGIHKFQEEHWKQH
jgi:hypothetical protein